MLPLLLNDRDRGINQASSLQQEGLKTHSSDVELHFHEVGDRLKAGWFKSN